MYDWRKKTDAEIVKFLGEQQSRFEAIRKPLEALMDLCTKYFLPRTYDMAKSRKPGEPFGISLYDSTPASARRKFANGFVSQTVNKSDDAEESWIHFAAPRRKLMEVDRIKQYMQEAAEQERYGFDRSTFYRQESFQQEVNDAAVLWGVETAERDLANDRIVFRRRDPRNHWFSLDRFGDIDIDHFKHKFTAKQLVEQFEKNRLPKKVIEQVEPPVGRMANPGAEYTVIQGIYVNGSIIHGSKHHDSKPFIQFYVLEGVSKAEKKELIAIEGVDWRPSVLRIGERFPSGYPISMAADALTSATYGNTLSKHGLIGSHALVQPPRLIHENLRDEITQKRLNPASNIFSGNPKEETIEFLTQKIDPSYLELMLARKKDEIEEWFYIPYFQAMRRHQDGTPPTATQIRQEVAEQIAQLTPIIESTEDDSLEPKVDIIWQYETDAGRMPDPPQELLDEVRGGKVKILNRFNGELRHLKRTLRQNQGMIESLAILKEFKEIWPVSLVIVKSKRLLERMLTNRIGQDMIFNDREVAEIEQTLAEAQQRQEELETAERMAKFVPSMTKDPVNPQSPAALMAGTAAA